MTKLEHSCVWMNPPCPNSVQWVSTVQFGPWIAGVWLCEIHKMVFEAMFSAAGVDGPKAIVVINRSPVIMSRQQLEQAQPQVPNQFLTCDHCGNPIYQLNGRWVHALVDVFPVKDEHEVRPG